MIHPYQLHPLSKIYYEALQEPRVRQLGHRAKTHRRSRSEELRHQPSDSTRDTHSTYPPGSRNR